MKPFQRFYALIRKIPRGCVATYGQIARLAGLPRHARQVGYALAALPDDSIPWYRVINSKGEVSARSLSPGADEQRARLKAEGLSFNKIGRISLRRFQWKPQGPSTPLANNDK